MVVPAFAGQHVLALGAKVALGNLLAPFGAMVVVTFFALTFLGLAVVFPLAFALADIGAAFGALSSLRGVILRACRVKRPTSRFTTGVTVVRLGVFVSAATAALEAAAGCTVCPR